MTSTAEDRVLAACRAAAEAEQDYALKAVTAGFLLIEYRAELMSCHDGNSWTNVQHWNDRTKSNSFKSWLEKTGIKERTAYRWINAAERVARLQLGLTRAEHLAPFIDVEGVVVPMSQALTAPLEELPAEARKFRQGVFDFMQDKTLAEAVTAAIDGESPAHRITRAAAGKLQGGSRGEDRKAWEVFIARKLSDVGSHLAHWKSFTQLQREGALEAFDRLVEKAPAEVLKRLQVAVKMELQRR